MTTEHEVIDEIIENGGDLVREPALEIGKLFANKAVIQPVIAALVAIVALVFGSVVDEELVENLATVVTFAAIVYGVWAAGHERKQSAIEQAEVTRERVVSPATAKKAVQVAAETGDSGLDVMHPETWSRRPRVL